jgi:hypothetical protein
MEQRTNTNLVGPPHASNSSTASTEEREEEESKTFSPLKIWDSIDDKNYK